MALETFQLRGRNYDDVVRQLISTYNSSQGWSLVRVVNRLTSLDVILERNSEQGVSSDTSKDTTKVEKVVDADATTSDEQPLETNDVVEDKPSATEAPTEKSVAVKTTRKSASKGQVMYGDLVIGHIKNKEGWEL